MVFSLGDERFEMEREKRRVPILRHFLSSEGCVLCGISENVGLLELKCGRSKDGRAVERCDERGP